MNYAEVRYVALSEMLGQLMSLSYEEGVLGVKVENNTERENAVDSVLRLIAELLSKNEADAERYRWLRDSAPEEWDVTRWLDGEHLEVHIQDYLDEAIDSAMERARG